MGRWLGRGVVVPVALLAAALTACGGADGSGAVTTTATPTTAVATSAATSAVTAAVGATTTPEGSAPKGERLTTAQALRLSRMLLLDRESGGADLFVAAPAGTMAAFELEGSVDWLHHQGSITARTRGTGASDVAGVSRAGETMVWADATLVIGVPGLEAAMAAKGRPGVRYASRALQAGTTTIDQVIVLIASLASDRAENPILLRQADTGFLGIGAIDGVDHERFRYGSTVYWVNPDGRIGRVEARLRTTTSPVTIDLRRHGPRTITVPAAASVVRAADIGDVLAELARR